jgi:hypothetical protein
LPGIFFAHTPTFGMSDWMNRQIRFRIYKKKKKKKKTMKFFDALYPPFIRYLFFLSFGVLLF